MLTLLRAVFLVANLCLLVACGSRSLGVGMASKNASQANDASATPTPTPTIALPGGPTPTPTPSASPTPGPDLCNGYAGTYAGGTCTFGGTAEAFTMSFTVMVKNNTCVATSIVAKGDYDEATINFNVTPPQAPINATGNTAEKNGKLDLTAVGKFHMAVTNTAAGALKVCTKP